MIILIIRSKIAQIKNKEIGQFQKQKKMKANRSGNIESRDDWETPNILWDKLDEQYNFQVDCCANKHNYKVNLHCEDFEITIKSNFIINTNVLTCWMNPPFSKAKKMFEHFFKVVSKGVAIYRCDNLETKIWQEIILRNADWIFIFDYRINYTGKKGTGSALIGIGVKPPKSLTGTTLFLNKRKGRKNKVQMDKKIKLTCFMDGNSLCIVK